MQKSVISITAGFKFDLIFNVFKFKTKILIFLITVCYILLK